MIKAKKKPGKRGGLQDDDVFVSVVGNVLTVNPIKVKTAHTGRQVKWTCNGGRLDVAFDKDPSPYGSGSFSSSASNSPVASGECVVKRKDTYSYTITVYPSGNKPKLTIDPQVEVDDPGSPGGYSGHGASGPAGGGKKKATARKATRKKTARKKAAKKKR